jgi:hypothetical protein
MTQEPALIAFMLEQQIRRVIMQNMTRFELLWRLDEDESGVDQVGQIMTVGLIVIPLVLVLVTFKDKVLDFLKEQFDKITGGDSGHNPFGG